MRKYAFAAVEVDEPSNYLHFTFPTFIHSQHSCVLARKPLNWQIIEDTMRYAVRKDTQETEKIR